MNNSKKIKLTTQAEEVANTFEPTDEEIAERDSVIYHSENDEKSREEVLENIAELAKNYEAAEQPLTYEEWVSIHGEPEFREVIETRSPYEYEPSIEITYYNEPIFDHTPYETSYLITEKSGKIVISEPIIAEWFTEYNNLRYWKGAFYTTEGVANADQVIKDVYDSIKDKVHTGTANKRDAIVKCLTSEAQRGAIEVKDRLVPFANGDMTIKDGTWTFELGRKRHTPYRLPVNFIPFHHRRATPYFDKWLNDLLYPDDILSLQEFIGYCLLPTTTAQEAFFLIGEAGVGKSRIETVIKSLIGGAWLRPQNMKEFLAGRFSLSELENKLVLYDDDLTDSGLEDASTFKSLITNTAEIMVERKYERPFAIKPYARILACGNHMLHPLYDMSDAVTRRIHPLLVKDKSPNWKEIPSIELDRGLKSEAEGIAQWALMGLNRLIQNNWKFTESERTKKYKAQFKQSINPFPEFMESVFEFGEGTAVTSKEIENAYKIWCDENSANDRKFTTLRKWLGDNAEKYGLMYSQNIPRGDRRVRGYFGAKIREEWKSRAGVISFK